MGLSTQPHSRARRRCQNGCRSETGCRRLPSTHNLKAASPIFGQRLANSRTEREQTTSIVFEFVWFFRYSLRPRFAHNGLVGGLSNREISPRLPKARNWRAPTSAFRSLCRPFPARRDFGRVVSGPRNPVSRKNGDRRQQRRGSNVATVQSNRASDADVTIRRGGRRAGPRPLRGGVQPLSRRGKPRPQAVCV
jgi:hypothetical protein